MWNIVFFILQGNQFFLFKLCGRNKQWALIKVDNLIVGWSCLIVLITNLYKYYWIWVTQSLVRKKSFLDQHLYFYAHPIWHLEEMIWSILSNCDICSVRSFIEWYLFLFLQILQYLEIRYEKYYWYVLFDMSYFLKVKFIA